LQEKDKTVVHHSGFSVEQYAILACAALAQDSAVLAAITAPAHQQHDASRDMAIAKPVLLDPSVPRRMPLFLLHKKEITAVHHLGSSMAQSVMSAYAVRVQVSAEVVATTAQTLPRLDANNDSETAISAHLVLPQSALHQVRPHP
jgi:hypothetical protein